MGGARGHEALLSFDLIDTQLALYGTIQKTK